VKKYLRYLGPVLVTAIFLLAVYLLYDKLKAYSIAQIRESLDRISHVRIALSLMLTAVNYLILVGYDWLALKAIGKSLALPRVGLVSFVGQAVSYNFGALLGGTTVRYRFYSAWGFSVADIVRLVLMLAVTFWVGALGLCGFIFIVSPPRIPDSILERLPVADIRILGVALFLVAVSYIICCFVVRKPLHVFGKEFVFPPPRIALAQAAVASVDIVAAAGCMYVLLPSDIGVSFMDFLPGYLMAQVAVVLTHIPGGVGVFELVILHLTHTPQEQTVFAAVLIFRLVYYIIPLLAAAAMLAVYEAHQNSALLRGAGRWLAVLSHSIAAYTTFLGGVILLVSATLPSRPRTFALLAEHLPKAATDVAHMACALAGAALLFLSYGLERRQTQAFRLSIAMLAIGCVCATLKGLSWEVSVMVGIVLTAVWLARRRFYRASNFWDEPVPWTWIGACFGALTVTFALGWFLYHPIWDRVAGWGFERYPNASRTLHAFIGVGIEVAGALLWRVARRRVAMPKRR
jgi:uncharacterized membrane protein YbhN (UPF0104 family)